MKKAQGLPLNTIVIALLVVIVLVVIVLAFTGSFSESNKTFSELSQDCKLICNSLGVEQSTPLAAGQVCSIPSKTLENGDECCCGEAESGGSGPGSDEVPDGVDVFTDDFDP